MSNIRTEKRSNYSVIANECFTDDRLSYREIGLLCYLLSKPNHWEAKVSQLVKAHREGRDAVRAAMRGLCTAGYVSMERHFGGVTYVVHEVPSAENQQTDFQDDDENQQTDFQGEGNQGDENPTLVSTESEQVPSQVSTERYRERTTEKPRARNAITHREHVIDAFAVTAERMQFAVTLGIDPTRVQAQTDAWRDHHKAKGSLLVDLEASWRNWMRRAVEYGMTVRTKEHGGSAPRKEQPPGKTHPFVRIWGVDY